MLWYRCEPFVERNGDWKSFEAKIADTSQGSLWMDDAFSATFYNYYSLRTNKTLAQAQSKFELMTLFGFRKK